MKNLFLSILMILFLPLLNAQSLDYPGSLAYSLEDTKIQNSLIPGFGHEGSIRYGNANVQDEYQTVFCQIVATQKLFSTKVSIAVDYGESRKFFQDNRLRDETGKVQTFNSVVDALNYMGTDGWSLAQAYVVTISNQNVYHYLMTKMIKNE